MPSEYFELQPPEEVAKCLSAHSKSVENCSDIWVAELKNLMTVYGENEVLLYSKLLPDSAKKIICCGFYSWETCALKAVSPTAGCESLLAPFLKQLEADSKTPMISINEFCVKFPKGQTQCS